MTRKAVAAAQPAPASTRRYWWGGVVTWYLFGADGRGGLDAEQAQALRSAWEGDLLVPGPIAVAAGLRVRAAGVDEALAVWDAHMLAATERVGLEPPVRGGWTVSRTWPRWGASSIVVGTAYEELNHR